MTNNQIKQQKHLEVVDTTISIVYITFLITFILTFFAPPEQAVIMFIALSCVITLLKLYKHGKIPLFVALPLSVVSLVTGFYFYYNYLNLVFYRTGVNTRLDINLAIVTILLFILISQLKFGWIMPGVSGIFIIYAFFGKYLPGVFYHPGVPLKRLLQELLLNIDGVYGMLPQVGLKHVAIFIAFAAMIRCFGGLEYIINVMRLISRKKTFFIPQLAVFGSMLFGSFTGSATANASGTGAFTIPMMKRYNIPSHMAAAIEAVASSGGQIMPPIMGAAAFVMAELLGVRYMQIVLIAFLPAFMFYFSTAVSVYGISLTYLKEPESTATRAEDEFRINKATLLQGIPIAIGVGTILYVLIGLKYDPMQAGTYGMFTFLVSQIVYELLFTKKGLKSFLVKVLDGIKSTAEESAPIIVMLAVLGTVVKICFSTGITNRIAYTVVELAGGLLLPTIILVMFVCILFGMAVTTVAAYLLVVIVAAPAMRVFGIPEMVTHFTVLYFAMLSAITPPIALTIPVVTSISGSSFFKTSIEAVKIGISLFILPFYFVFRPALFDLTPESFALFALGCIGLGGISLALQIHLKGKEVLLFRAVLLLGGIATLFAPGMILSSVGAVVVLLAIAVFVRVGKNRISLSRIQAG